MKAVRLNELETMDPKTKAVRAIIETPRGDRVKYKYDPENDLFALHKVLPAGAVFPYAFGFLPSTLGEDGDPLDVLIITDGPMWPGILVPVRLIGVIEAEQTEDKKTIRNDRLIGAAMAYPDYQAIQELSDLSDSLVEQIEQFFVNYNRLEGKKFTPLARKDAKEAEKLLTEGQKRFKEQRSQG